MRSSADQIPKSWPSVNNAAVILVPLEIWNGRGIVAEEEGVDERAARAVGSVVLFDAQGTLFTQRASVAFGDALGRTSSPERRPATLPAIKGGGTDLPTVRLEETECGEDVRLQFSTRQKVLPALFATDRASSCLWISTRLLSLFLLPTSSSPTTRSLIKSAARPRRHYF